MSRLFSYSVFIFLMASLFLIQGVQAQVVDNVDEAFEEARELAFSGDREKARNLGYAILEQSPNYHDVRILVARTFSWDGNYAKAREELNYVLNQSPKYRDALLAATDNEIWAEKYNAALQFSEQAVEYYPSNSGVLLKRAKALFRAKKESEALQVLNRLERIDPTNKEAQTLRRNINISQQNYTFTASYTYDTFEDIFGDIQKSYVQLSRRTKYGSVIGRLNYQNRFATNGLQAEIDFYPSIAEGWYGYISAGFSGSFIFPEVRGGAELYKILPRSFEISAGVRYLRYSNNIWIYTGTITKYYGNWLFTARPFITPNSVGVSRSLNLIVRRYFSGADNYVSVRGGFGFSPEERRFQDVTGSVFLTESQFMGVDFSKQLRYNVIASVSLDVTRQELSFDPGRFINVFTFSTGFQYKF